MTKAISVRALFFREFSLDLVPCVSAALIDIPAEANDASDCVVYRDGEFVAVEIDYVVGCVQVQLYRDYRAVLEELNAGPIDHLGDVVEAIIPDMRRSALAEAKLKRLQGTPQLGRLRTERMLFGKGGSP